MKTLKNLNARPKLLLAFGVMLALILGCGYLGLSSLTQANDRILYLNAKDMKGLAAADAIVIDRMSLGRYGRDAIMNMRNTEVVAKDLKIIDTNLADLPLQIEDFAGRVHTDQGKAQVATMRQALPAYVKSYQDLSKAVLAKDLKKALAALDLANMVGPPINASADQARTDKLRLGQQLIEENVAVFHVARAMILGIAALSLVVGVVLSLVIAGGFSAPLGRAVAALELVAEGDLTVSLDVESTDEVGRIASALNMAMERLRTTLREVAESASNASASSQELASAAESIASGAQEQAASLEETSASLEQITATVRQSADNARQASQLATGSRDSAERGQGVVVDAVAAMAEINAASAKISNIISTIDEIAFQTNLLAVNAAVEAARAGDEGRGFAVVATEVRSLAQRSAGAAKEIKGLIQDSLSKVKRGMELVNRSGETLHGIVDSVKRVTDIVSDISVASQEQSTGIEQVNSAMTQMDQVTQSNSAHTEELSATAQTLSEQSAQLLVLVQGFNLGDELKPELRGSVRAISGRPAAAKVPSLKVDLRTKTFAKKKSRPSTPLVAVTSVGPDVGGFEEF